MGEARRRWPGTGSADLDIHARTWVAHLEMSLDNDHHWLGGVGHTMQDTINALREGGDEAA